MKILKNILKAVAAMAALATIGFVGHSDLMAEMNVIGYNHSVDIQRALVALLVHLSAASLILYLEKKEG